MHSIAIRRCAAALAIAMFLAGTWTVHSHAQSDTAHADSLFGVSEWDAAATAYAAIVRDDASNARAWFRMA